MKKWLSALLILSLCFGSMSISSKAESVSGQQMDISSKAESDFGQQTDISSKAESDFGQQTDITSKAESDFGQQTDITSKAESDFGQQTDITSKAESDFGQQTDITSKAESNIGQQTSITNKPELKSDQQTLLSKKEDQERYIVFFEREVDVQAIVNLGGTVIQDFPLIHAATVEVGPNEVAELERLPFFQKIVKENKVEAEGQSVPWGHSNLNLPAKQPSTLTGKGVKVAVIDTGVDRDHPDLAVKGGTCVLDVVGACDKSFDDEEGHGTHVAGIIAALDNNIGVVGIAPGAEIYAVKALDAEGYGTSTTIMAGIQWAIENKMDIINLSLTTPNEDYGIKSMIDKAYKNGIIIVAAAGNIGTVTGKGNTVLYPAKYPNVIAVAATNPFDRRISTSSTGEEVDLAAPGEEIYSTIPGGYGLLRGTSMAAPHVVGLAALYKEKYPEASNIEIRKMLELNAKDLGLPGKDTFYGYGLAQVDSKLESSHDISVTYSTKADGTVSLNMLSLLEKYKAYNLYRFDQRVLENASVGTAVDYAGQGHVFYKIYPVENGIENRDEEIKVNVTLDSPYFSDMNNELWYNRYLVYLNSEDIVYGYGENRIKPTKLVTRAEAVTMLGRALKLSGTARPSRFKDVGATSFASGYIESAAEKGILKGRPDGTFRPDQPVTRAEMAILLASAYSLPNVTDIHFSDVSSGMAGYQEILNLAGSRITEGYPDGTFKPGANMNRATFAVFLAKARGLK